MLYVCNMGQAHFFCTLVVVQIEMFTTQTDSHLLALPDACPRAVAFSAGAGPLLRGPPGVTLIGPELEAA